MPSLVARRERSSEQRRRSPVNMVVGLALTLLVVLVAWQSYQVIWQTHVEWRAVFDPGPRMDAAVEQLRDDLAGLTKRERPLGGLEGPTPGDGSGYLEIWDGPQRGWERRGHEDALAANDPSEIDCDDVLAFSARREPVPFTGRRRTVFVAHPEGPMQYSLLTSPTAEIVWWVTSHEVDATSSSSARTPLDLHRRVLLLRADLNDPDSGLLYSVGTREAADRERFRFQADNDLSVRVAADRREPTLFGLAANSLADLADPRNRFAHLPGEKPQAVLDWSGSLLHPAHGHASEFYGEDVVLSDLTAFDVRVLNDAAVAAESEGVIFQEWRNPEAAPWRELQVRVRIREPYGRQVREATVTTSFQAKEQVP